MRHTSIEIRAKYGSVVHGNASTKASTIFSDRRPKSKPTACKDLVPLRWTRDDNAYGKTSGSSNEKRAKRDLFSLRSISFYLFIRYNKRTGLFWSNIERAKQSKIVGSMKSSSRLIAKQRTLRDLIVAWLCVRNEGELIHRSTCNEVKLTRNVNSTAKKKVHGTFNSMGEKMKMIVKSVGRVAKIRR